MPQLNQLLDLSPDMDERSVQILLKSIHQNNQEGFDFLEFLASVDKLKSMPMDEATAYKSAFATASTFGITKHHLTTSAQKYLTVLRSEYDLFAAALNRQIQQRIEDPKQKVTELMQRKNQIDIEVEKLRKEQSLIDETVRSLTESIESEHQKLKSQEAQFRSSYDAIKAAIELNIQNIENQL